MRQLIFKIWNTIGMNDGDVDACADDRAIYIEVQSKFYKMVPVEVSADEFNKAWDWNRSNKKQTTI